MMNNPLSNGSENTAAQTRTYINVTNNGTPYPKWNSNPFKEEFLSNPLLKKNNKRMTIEEERRAIRKVYNGSYLEKYRKRPEIKEEARVYQKEYRQRDYVKAAHRLVNTKWNRTKAF